MKAIPEFPEYFATKDGRVWSAKGRGLFLKPWPDDRGYPQVNLYKDGETFIRRVHSLVAVTFLGPRPAGLEVRHLDGNPANADVRNLKYGTGSENSLDTVAHGMHHEAKKTHCKRGHEFTPENTYFPPGRPRRECRRCRAGRKNAWRRKSKGAVAAAAPVTELEKQ